MTEYYFHNKFNDAAVLCCLHLKSNVGFSLLIEKCVYNSCMVRTYSDEHVDSVVEITR